MNNTYDENVTNIKFENIVIWFLKDVFYNAKKRK